MEGNNRYLAECLTDGWEEISQEKNLNANARLFRKKDTVRKLYTANAESNISILKGLAERKDLEAVPELILPRRILLEGGTVFGYEMPLAQGRTWSAMAEDPAVPAAAKLLALERVADALRRFPADLIWGDVHGDNIIVCGETVRIVDPDGFGLSCPLEHLSPGLPGKYRREDGQVRISRDSDVLGLCEMALRQLLNGYSFYLFPQEWKRKYLSFLEDSGAAALAETVKSTLEDGPNILPEGAFDIGAARDLSYGRFLKESGLWQEEKQQEQKIDRWIEERNETK